MTFDDLTSRLNKAMTEEYVAVNKDTNPIAKTELSKDQLEYVIGQYSIFPKNITSFLYEAREKARQAGWKDADIELTRNLGEELGTETNGVPHYKWLLNCVKADFDLDLSGIKPSPSTNAFIESMTAAMANPQPSYVMGAIYACESSAVPELKIVRDIASPIPEDGKLKGFFERHINNFEIGHEDKLRRACEPHVSEEPFEQGFRDVMEIMDEWWNGLYDEISL